MTDEHADALLTGPVRGRGAGLNPGNRFEDVRLHVLGDHLDEQHRSHPDGVQVHTRTLDDRTRSLINRVDSPDLPFRWTLNPYRGCEHGCIYCYARPTHELLGLSCGLDFETTIMVKRDAPTLLRRELAAPRWCGETIAMSGVTDPYQPVERELRITRGCLEVMEACGQPVGVVTKSRLIVRDADLLGSLAARGAACVSISITTLDDDLARRMEPRASAPRARLRAITELTDAGVPVMILVSPVVPGLTDHEMPDILRAGADAGAVGAGWSLLRLPHQVKALFLDWLEREHPDRAARVERAVRETRDGRLSEWRFGARMRGAGARAEHLARTFEIFKRRYGLDRSIALSSRSFRAPTVNDGQMCLFDEG